MLAGVELGEEYWKVKGGKPPFSNSRCKGCSQDLLPFTSAHYIKTSSLYPGGGRA